MSGDAWSSYDHVEINPRPTEGEGGMRNFCGPDSQGPPRQVLGSSWCDSCHHLAGLPRSSWCGPCPRGDGSLIPSLLLHLKTQKSLSSGSSSCDSRPGPCPLTEGWESIAFDFSLVTLYQPMASVTQNRHFWAKVTVPSWVQRTVGQGCDGEDALI